MGSLNDRLAGHPATGRPASAPPVRAQTEPAGLPNGPQADHKWAVIEPAYSPQEEVLLVLDQSCLAEARTEHPGLATWLASEINLIAPFKDNHEFLRGIHRIKKHLGAWLREIRPPRQTTDGARVAQGSAA